MMPNFADLLAHGAHDRLVIDSRTVQAGDIFIAIDGSKEDGARYISDALSRGAGLIVCRPEYLEDCQGKGIAHEQPRRALWQLAQAHYQTQKLPFRMVGVTGTNGKTTVTYLLEHLFHSAGKKVGALGTISYRWPGHETPAPLTTPDTLELHAMLAAMAQAGVEYAFMEVSSHALDQERVGGIDYSGAVLTNITQDHLDYHQTMDAYFNAKARLFLEYPRADKLCVLNADDAYGRRLLERVDTAIGYSINGVKLGRRPMTAEILSLDTTGMHLRMHFEGRSWELRSPLVGRFNAANLLAAQAMALSLGMQPENFACLEHFYGVPGRLERIADPKGRGIFVDYAHTPDALINVLKTLREAGFARIITVFGCGGNRDRSKRPLMGAAVAQYSDIAVLTSDNPRHEEAQGIMNDVLPGLAGAGSVHMEMDRRKALALALEIGQAHDAILVAGKGHEEYQIIGDTRHPFSDQQIIRNIVSCS